MINYLPESAKVYRLKNPPEYRTGFDQFGYCRKGSSHLYVVLAGENRKRKVWVTCISNVASHWIIVKGETIHLHDCVDIAMEKGA